MILVSCFSLGLAASLSLGALNETVKKQLGLTTGNWETFESKSIESKSEQINTFKKRKFVVCKIVRKPICSQFFVH